MLVSRSRGLCRGGLVTDAVLLLVFLALAFIFIQRRGYMGKVNSHLENQQGRGSGAGSAGDGKARLGAASNINIDERIRKIPDARTLACKSHAVMPAGPVTIIISFYDYQFYDLRTTVLSILHNTKHEDIAEIILVDDGSTLDYIKDESKAFANKVNLIKLLRMTSKVGTARARMRAVHESTTEYLVFLDTTVVCTEGWLHPLTELLKNEKSAIAVPHYDSINNPISYDYTKTDWDLLVTFSWSLTMRVSPSHVTNKEHIAPFVASPALRGTAWAVRKHFLLRIGGFDETMNEHSAESLEFALRAWMCGGVVKVLPCSRVGVLNLKDPVKVTAQENIRRIVNLWMAGKKEFIYRHTGVTRDMDSAERLSLKERQAQLSSLECKSFSWYQQNIIPDIYTPTANALSYGLLRCKSGRCARVGDDRRMELGQCKPDQYRLHPRMMIFEHTSNHTITVGGRCLTVLPTAYIVVEDCRKSDSKQMWDLRQNGVLRNVWSNYCAMHVTDPDKKVPKGRQIMMAQECPADQSGMFIQFEFILT